MRFLLVLISIYGSVSYASVDNFNSMIAESTQQERRLHRRLLQTIQNTQYAIAYNDKIEKIQDSERVQKIDPHVTLIQYTE